MKILVATDGSEYSDEALKTVRSRPWPVGSTVRILSAVSFELPPPPAPAWSGVKIGYKEFQEIQRSEAEALVARAKQTIHRDDLTVETAVRMGDPRAAILDEAEEWSADLIIVGSRGLTGLKRWILGSVAQHIVAHAPCSVEVARSKARG
jgi:nucleotide-binding universal stress UspA family protein